MTKPSDAYNPRLAATTSGWAVASLVLGILGVVVLSVIFGLVALAKIRDYGGKGRAIAISGLVVSGIWVVAAVVAIVAKRG